MVKIDFIDVLGGDGTWHLINPGQITKVSCKVERTQTSAGLKIASHKNPSPPASPQADAEVVVTIRILTANGEGHISFDSEGEADMWAYSYLGISDFILRSQTLER